MPPVLLLPILAAHAATPTVRSIHPEVAIGLSQADDERIEEWLIPVFGGYEHGFTVYDSDDDVLDLHVGMRGADAFQDGEDLLFVTQGGDAIRYSDLLAWDATGRELQASMEAAPGGFRIVVDLVGARFPVTVDPLTSTPWVALRPANGLAGMNVANAGDVNGDGRPDVLVAAPLASNGNTNEGRVSLYYGSPMLTFFRGADWSTECNTDDCYMGYGEHTLAGVGDVNGDGYDDFAVGMPYKTGVSAFPGAVAVYYGGLGGPTAPTWIGATAASYYEDISYFGDVISGAGDVNGDGYDDLIVTESGDLYLRGTVHVYHGGPSGISTTPAANFTGTGSFDYCGMAVTGLGDINTDGYDEIAYSCAYDARGALGPMMLGQIVVVAGGPTGAATANGTWTITGTVEFGALGEALDAGDINGDGIPDLLAASGYWDSSSGGHTTAAFAYLGNGAGLDATASWSVEGVSAASYFGPSIAFVPDVNNDGWPEVALGIPDYSSDVGTVELFYGSATGPSTTAGWSWTADRTARAGISIAGLGNAAGLGSSGDLIVGASVWDLNTADSVYEGRAFVFRGAP